MGRAEKGWEGVRVWEAGTGTLVENFSANCFAWNPDGQTLAVVGDNLLTIWDVEKRATRKTVKIAVDGYSQSAWRPDGRQIAIWHRSYNGSRSWLTLVDIFTERSTNIPTANEDYYQMSWSPDGGLLALATGQRVQLVDPFSREVSTPDFTSPIFSIAWSPDSSKLAALGVTTALTLELKDTVVGNISTVIIPTKVESFSGRGIAWSPDAKQLAFCLGGESSGVLCRIDTNSWETIKTVVTAATGSLDWSPDGRFLASGGWGGAILYSTTTGSQMKLPYSR